MSYSRSPRALCSTTIGTSGMGGPADVRAADRELAEREEFVDGSVYAYGEEVAVREGLTVCVDAEEGAVVD
jgi:hypothetical protein